MGKASAKVRLDSKGRAAVPAAVRAEAGLESGAELTIRAEGTGRVVLESRHAIRKRIRVRAKAAHVASGLEGSVVDSLLNDRRREAQSDG